MKSVLRSRINPTTDNLTSARRMPGSVAPSRSEAIAPNQSALRSAESVAPATKRVIIIVEQRVLIRDCLVRCLNGVSDDQIAIGFSALSEWLDAAPNCPAPRIIILCIPSMRLAGAQIERDLAALSKTCSGTPVVVLTDSDGPDHVVGALNKGARGYVPTSVTFDVAVEAIRLVEAGGAFVPASSLLSPASFGVAGPSGAPAQLLTRRQAAVVEAIRRGKANKQIAYELNMREGTVKVHVRNIMRKLKVRNRTEVALWSSGLHEQLGKA